MNYESSKEKLSTNPKLQVHTKGIPEEKKRKIAELFKQGMSATDVAQQVGVSKAMCLCIRTDLENAGEFKFGSWKKQTAKTISEIVTKGLDRLNNGGIEEMPIGQVPLAMAIMIDKGLVLQDAPTQVVEHRLKVTHEDINKMLSGDVIDVQEVKPQAIERQDAQD